MGIQESMLACKKCAEKSCLKMCPKGLRIPQIIEEIKELTQAHVWNSVVYGSHKCKNARNTLSTALERILKVYYGINGER